MHKLVLILAALMFPEESISASERSADKPNILVIVGKWHLGSLPEMHPQQRGFDEFFGFLGGAHSYFETAGILRGTEPVNELDYTTDAFGREASWNAWDASNVAPLWGGGIEGGKKQDPARSGKKKRKNAQ